MSQGEEQNHTETHCRSFRACPSSQSLIISPTDVFWVFHMMQMKAICTHTGQSKHLLKGIRGKKKKWPTTWRKPPQTCSGRAVCRDAISEGGREGDGALAVGGVKLLDRTTYRISILTLFKLGRFLSQTPQVCLAKALVASSDWGSSDLHWGLFDTCWAERWGWGGGLPSPWIPGISGGYLSQALDSVIDNPPPPKKIKKITWSISSSLYYVICGAVQKPILCIFPKCWTRWSFQHSASLPEWPLWKTPHSTFTELTYHSPQIMREKAPLKPYDLYR